MLRVQSRGLNIGAGTLDAGAQGCGLAAQS
jgi:hypothetical protein